MLQRLSPGRWPVEAKGGSKRSGLLQLGRVMCKERVSNSIDRRNSPPRQPRLCRIHASTTSSTFCKTIRRHSKNVALSPNRGTRVPESTSPPKSSSTAKRAPSHGWKHPLTLSTLPHIIPTPSVALSLSQPWHRTWSGRLDQSVFSRHTLGHGGQSRVFYRLWCWSPCHHHYVTVAKFRFGVSTWALIGRSAGLWWTGGAYACRQ